MSWWYGLDNEIYVDMGAVRSRLTGGAPPGPAANGPEAPRPPANGSAAPWPAALGARPTAVLARQVAAPNYEMLRFVRLARRNGFRPLVIEHRGDRFTVHNPYKRSLATLPIVVGRSRDGQPILRRQRVVDTAAAEGRRLDEVTTLRGEPLLAYHHRKLGEVMGAEAPEVAEIRDVVAAHASGPAAYYVEFFKMLSGPLVLFEDFVADDQTAAFFQRTVLPAWRQAAADTGRAPQIARLVPGRRTSSPIWNAYPPAMADDPSWVRPARAPLRAPAPLPALAAR